MAKILLADDSATMQKVVDVVLKEEGFDVQSANNGEEAVGALSSYQPDLVLAYIKLPGINGYELTKQIKAAGATPVILLAGAFEPVDEALMAECGADDSLVKPFQTEDLLAVINKFVSGEAKAAEAAEDDIVFDMSGGEEDLVQEAEVVEAEVVEAAPADPFAGGGGAAEAPVEAEVVEAEIVEAEIYEAEVVETEPAAPVAPVAAAAMPEINMPSADELSALFMKTAEEKIVEALKGAELRTALITLLEPHIQKTVSDMLEETMPVLIQKLLKEMLEDGLSMLNRELENIMWETVPELAETLIKKEIEKIKAEG